MNISQKYSINDRVLRNMIPEDNYYLPDPGYELPVFLRDGLISPDGCDSILDALQNYSPRGATGGVGHDGAVVDEIRKVQLYKLCGPSKFLYEWAYEDVKPDIEKYFNAKIGDSEGATGMGYQVGDFYINHSDNSLPVVNGNGQTTHFSYESRNRQLSSILFLTDGVDEITSGNQCIGGNLTFGYIFDDNEQPLLIEPKRGRFVVFPSNPIYSHQVNEVYAGFRMTIVNWYSASFL